MIGTNAVFVLLFIAVVAVLVFVYLRGRRASSDADDFRLRYFWRSWGDAWRRWVGGNGDGHNGGHNGYDWDD